MLDLDGVLLNDEEKYVLNKVAIDVSRDECCDRLLFGSEVTTDEECASVLLELCSKLKNLKPDDWEELQNYLPFELSFIDADLEFDETVFENEGVIN